MRPVALVTGAGSGIGAATAELLAAAGHDLILVARRADRLEHLAGVYQAAGARVEVLSADLSTVEGLARVAERAAAGDVDLLVSNAYRPLTAFDPAEIDGLWRLNAIAHITLTRAVLPAMQARGTRGVITVASLLAFSAGVDLGFPRALYVAAKAALVGLTRSLALELRGSGVTATVVCPGLVDTDWSGGANHGDPRAMPANDVAPGAVDRPPQWRADLRPRYRRPADHRGLDPYRAGPPRTRQPCPTRTPLSGSRPRHRFRRGPSGRALT